MGRFYGNHIAPILTVPVVQLVCWIVDTIAIVHVSMDGSASYIMGANKPLWLAHIVYVIFFCHVEVHTVYSGFILWGKNFADLLLCAKILFANIVSPIRCG